MKNLKTSKAFGMLLLACVIFCLSGCGDDNSSVNNGARPAITGITPTQVALGQRNVEGRIQGQNLSGVTSVSLGDSILVQSFQSVSAAEIAIEFTVGNTAQPGPRAISVTTSAGNASSAAIFTVQNNHVPVATFTIQPRVGSKNSEITFDASGSTDDGNISKYEWDFGDNKSAAGKIVTHKYAAAGTYNVKLNLTDNQQATNFASRSLEIENNRPPVARFSISPGTGDTNTEFTFDGSDSEDNDGKIVRYSWDFGDGKKAEGKTVKHAFADDKTFTVGLTVTDNDNAQDIREKDLAVEKGHSGGGGGCHATVDGQSVCSGNDFKGQSFCVVSIQGNVMITSTNLQRCPGKCGEVRRNGDGIREFAGDIDRIDGTRVTLDYGRLPASTRPKPGERLRAIWRPCK